MPDEPLPPEALGRGSNRPREIQPWAPGPAPVPPDRCLKDGAVYVAPDGTYVYAAYLPEEGGWKLMTEERREGRDYLVNAKDNTVSVVWESEGFSTPAAQILEEFVLTSYVVDERCGDCGVYMLPEHGDYCDYRIRDGQWWRADQSSAADSQRNRRAPRRDRSSET